MDFSLTKEEALIQKMAREFAEKNILPIAEQIDHDNMVPDEIIKGLAELELMGIPFDEKYGGADAGYVSYVLAMEQIARCSSGVTMVLSAHTLATSSINAFGSEEQKLKYLPKCCNGENIASFAFTEPGTGSDPKQITTTATKDGDSYILNGTKRFISNANYPGPIVIFARETETNEITAFIVDKWCEGYSISEPWKKMGLHGGLLLDVYMKDVRVPASNLLGQPGQGYPILQLGISFGKIGVSSSSLGGILASYEEGLKYAKEKTHRGVPIAKFQSIQLKVAELAMILESSRWLTYRLGYLANNFKNPFVFAKEAALTKTVVCDNSVKAARVSLDIHGSYGCMEDYKVSRLYKDAIIGPQIEGVEDMQKMIIAGVLLKG